MARPRTPPRPWLMTEIATLRAGMKAGHSRVKLAVALGRTPEAIAAKSRELRPWRLRPARRSHSASPIRITAG